MRPQEKDYGFQWTKQPSLISGFNIASTLHIITSMKSYSRRYVPIYNRSTQPPCERSLVKNTKNVTYWQTMIPSNKASTDAKHQTSYPVSQPKYALRGKTKRHNLHQQTSANKNQPHPKLHQSTRKLRSKRPTSRRYQATSRTSTTDPSHTHRKKGHIP